MEFHYKILKISNNATYKEIKYAYRCLSKINHPDKVFTGTEKQKIEAGETFKQIKKAYDNLINPHSRKKYDDKLNKYWEKEQTEWIQGYDPYEKCLYYFNYKNRLCKWNLDDKTSIEHYKFLELGKYNN